MSLFALDIIVRASALLAAATLGDLVLRRRSSAATRHLLWTLALGALLALPIASYVLPEWTVPIPIARQFAPSVAAWGQTPARGDLGSDPNAHPLGRTRMDSMDSQWRKTGGSDPNPPARATALADWPRLTASAALSAVYAAGVVLLLARFFLEPFVLRRLTRASRDVTDAAWRRLRDEAATRLRLSRRVRLMRSERDVMPLTFGTIAPTIVLPASADDWTDNRRRAVLLHELAHVARRDCLVQRIAACACALYWPHPGVWWAAKRLRAEQELACDDRVLASGADRAGLRRASARHRPRIPRGTSAGHRARDGARAAARTPVARDPRRGAQSRGARPRPRQSPRSGGGRGFPADGCRPRGAHSDRRRVAGGVARIKCEGVHRHVGGSSLWR